jgi:hypothetical protein
MPLRAKDSSCPPVVSRSPRNSPGCSLRHCVGPPAITWLQLRVRSENFRVRTSPDSTMAPTPCLSAIQSVSSDRTAITRLRGRQVRILYTVHCASLQPQPAARQCHAMMRIANSECDTVTPGSRVSGTTPPDDLTVATDGTLPVCRSDPMSEIPPSTAVPPVRVPASGGRSAGPPPTARRVALGLDSGECQLGDGERRFPRLTFQVGVVGGRRGSSGSKTTALPTTPLPLDDALTRGTYIGKSLSAGTSALYWC